MSQVVLKFAKNSGSQTRQNKFEKEMSKVKDLYNPIFSLSIELLIECGTEVSRDID
jgi:hypothetical protein